MLDVMRRFTLLNKCGTESRFLRNLVAAELHVTFYWLVVKSRVYP